MWKGLDMIYENNESVPFRAFITNAGKYSEGELVGKWVDFPTTAQHMKDVMNDIGIGSERTDGTRYEEIFITDYDCNIPELERGLGEYSSIDELNHLATLIDKLDDEYSEILYAAFETEYSGNTGVAVNLVENIQHGAFELLSGIKNEEDMGRHLISEKDENIPEWLKSYIDYEDYGRDESINRNGSFSSKGYIEMQGDYKEYYKGQEDIPKEERVMVSDKENISDKEKIEEAEPDLTDETAPRM